MLIINYERQLDYHESKDESQCNSSRENGKINDITNRQCDMHIESGEKKYTFHTPQIGVYASYIEAHEKFLSLSDCQPHQIRTNNLPITKSKSSLLGQKCVQIREPKYRHNISAIWQNKRLNRQRKLSSNQAQNQTASFYLKKGDKPIYYQLKMDIKKVDASTKPPQKQVKKVLKNRYRCKNFPTVNEKSSNNNFQIQQTPKNEHENIQYVKQANQISQQTTSISLKNTIQKSSRLKKQIQIQKQRSIKSTLISYSSKINLKKKREEQSESPELFHIKNLLTLQLKPNQESIQLVEPLQFRFIQNPNILSQGIQKTANSYLICHYNNSNKTLLPIIGKQYHKRVQIASITKIMTCFLAINISRVFRLNLKQQKVLVSQRASKMSGTSAQLNYSDVLSVYNLLHGLMLPSGNDAAVAIAQWGGKTIRKFCGFIQKHKGQKTLDTKSMNFLYQYGVERKSYIKLFIYHMNKAANMLMLKNTKFANVHGLMNQKAFSTAHDVVLLTCFAMNNEIFSEVVRKRQYSCKLYNRTFCNSRTIQWRNTNKLLNNEGFLGVKTGITPSAGPCLSSMFQINQFQSIIIVVLKVKSMQMRFKQSLEFLKESLSYLGYGKMQSFMNKLGDQDFCSGCEETDRAQQANLIQQKQIFSDQQNYEDQQDES